jgi:hypothetical protein
MNNLTRGYSNLKRGYRFCEGCLREVRLYHIKKLWIDRRFVYFCNDCKIKLMIAERQARMGRIL